MKDLDLSITVFTIAAIVIAVPTFYGLYTATITAKPKETHIEFPANPTASPIKT